MQTRTHEAGAPESAAGRTRRPPGWALAWACAAAAPIAAVGLVLAMAGGRDAAWLGRQGPAEWIVYPSPGDPGPRPAVELDAAFRRTFDLDQVPARAELGVRGFRKVAVWVNGQLAARATDGHWKEIQRSDVAHLLRSGRNEIAAHVLNGRGPPALWLSLQLGGTPVLSDERWDVSWAGATVRKAALATDPVRGRRHDIHGRLVSPWEGLVQHRWAIALLATISGAFALVVSRIGARPGGPGARLSSSPWPLRLAVAACGTLWIALFVHNSPLLPIATGFDSVHHLDYVQWILDRRSIPLATDGWQMFQPPLYYLVLAAAFAVGGVSAAAESAAAVVRALGLATGIAHLILVAACMRTLLPGRARAQVIGLCAGAFLPCMLYMHHFPANEPLTAALSTGALLTGLVLSRGPGRWRTWALLGFVLGLALLTKVSAVIVCIAVLGALSAQAVLGERTDRRARVLGLSVSVGVLVVTCGWYFLWVWSRLGRPFVGGWEAERGMGWWQDPGYRTAADFLRFGRALTSSAFAGNGGFWDGWYSTLWGDGLLSALGHVDLILPWVSPSRMGAGYLLALVPSVALLAGAIAELVGWVRRPAVASGMILLLASLTILAIGVLCMEVPSVVADKASYGLLALVPLAALCASAMDRVMSRSTWLRILAVSGLATWAGMSYMAHWIDGASADAQMRTVVPVVAKGDWLPAMRRLHDIATRNPDHGPSHLMLAGLMLDLDAPGPEIVRELDARDSWPDVASHRLVLSRLAAREGQWDRALAEARQAVGLAPEDPRALRQYATILSSSGHTDRAIEAWRDVLAVDAHGVIAHRQLATLLARKGDPAGAALHRERATLLGKAISALPDR